MRRTLVSLCTLACLSLSCGGGSDAPRCVPGEVQRCPCAGATESTQTCASDGTFGACECGVGGEDAGDGAEDGGAAVDAGTGPGDAGALTDAGSPADGAPADGSIAQDAATDGGGVGTGCESFRVRFDARRDRATVSSRIAVRVRGPMGADVGTIDFPTGEYMPYEFALPRDAMLADDHYLDVSVTNGSVQSLVIERGGAAYEHVDGVLSDGSAGSFTHHIRLYVPTECQPSLAIATEAETPIDVTVARSLRVAPAAGESVYVWARLSGCTVRGTAERDGRILVDFIPDGASFDHSTRGMRELQRNPFDVDVVFEDVRIGDGPGTLWFTSAVSDPTSPFRYDCTVQLRTQYR